MNDRIQRNTPALVEQTLANHGAWDTVSFLLISQRLRQHDYEAWRMGDVVYLEDTVAGNRQRILDMLDAALMHAQSMGLVSVPTTWFGWGKQAGRQLYFFHDEETNNRFQLRLEPKPDRPQLDLFMDVPHTVLLNRLRQALLHRSSDTDTLFERAFDEIANEPALARLDTIRAAMKNNVIEDPLMWFNYLSEVIAPASRDEFPHCTIDIMASLWRSAAVAMASLPFDPANSMQDASEAWLRAGAWEQCLEAIGQIPDWYDYATLHERRIAALSAIEAYEAVRQGWMMFCWHCPEAAATALSQADLHACGLHRLWQQFLQLEAGQSVEAFPALMAINGQHAAQQADAFEHSRHLRGWHSYQLVTDLLAQEQYGHVDVKLRRLLKENSDGLFRAFMATRRSHDG